MDFILSGWLSFAYVGINMVPIFWSKRIGVQVLFSQKNWVGESVIEEGASDNSIDKDLVF